MANNPFAPQASQPQQQQQGPNLPDWMKDPANIMTGLVFLASLAQPRAPGQSSLGAFGERAVGALGVRGGLAKGVREQELTAAEAEAKRQQEAATRQYQQQQVGVAQQGIAVDREKLASQEKQTAAEISAREKLKGIPEALPPEQADYLKAQAEWLRRRNAEGAAGGKASEHDKFLSEWLIRYGLQEIDQENQNAFQEGRKPDLAGVMKKVTDTSRVLEAVKAGAAFSTDPDTGDLGFKKPAPVAGSEQAPGTALPGQAGTPAALPAPVGPGLDPAALQEQARKTGRERAVGRKGPAPSEILMQRDTAAFSGMKNEELEKIMRSGQATPAQRLTISGILKARGRKEMSKQGLTFGEY
jgi:hypothetical protein